MQSKEYYSEIFHEIKNSVALINGYLQLLEKKLPKLEQNDYFITIQKEISRLRKIVTEFSQLRFGENLQLESADIRSFLTDCCDSIHSLHHTERLHCSLSMPETPLWVSLDNRQLRHAIMNLLKNACEAMNYHGTISVTAYAKNSQVHISIADSGPGIPTALLPHIFEPFTTTKENGSGLGLNIVQQILFAHNGTITVNSSTEKGCTFLITLPILEYEKMV